jgi:hypothetical protein
MDRAAQCAIQRIIALRRSGLSLRAISASIAADGVKLSHEGVKNVLAAADNTVGDNADPFRYETAELFRRLLAKLTG